MYLADQGPGEVPQKKENEGGPGEWRGVVG